MSAMTAKQRGSGAAKVLHERLANCGLLDDLLPRVLATMPSPVQEAHAEDPRFLPMFGATAGQYAMDYGCARLCVQAAPGFTRRVLGLFPVADRDAWQQFTDGVIEYAVTAMKHPATRGDIVEYINDRDSAIERFCTRYPVEARPVLEDAARQIERFVRDVLREGS